MFLYSIKENGVRGGNSKMLCHCRRHFLTLLAGASTTLFSVGIFSSFANAQKRLVLTGGTGCSFNGVTSNDELYAFSPSKHAKELVANISDQVGLPQNFIVLQANVSSAAAVIQDGVRYILYSEDFMDKIYDQTNTNLSGLTIIAHEVGHHLSGHTLKSGGSRPPTELEADKFSGFIGGRLGSDLEELLLLFRSLPEKGSSTHPPRSARIEAAIAGWKLAKEKEGDQPEQSKSKPYNPIFRR